VSFRRSATFALLPLLLAAAACGDRGEDDPAVEDGAVEAPAPPDEPIKLGYSAWPGWYPWVVAEEAGIFDEVGANVELVYFSSYLASLDAMAAGQLDANSQTLNDTLVSVSTGADHRIVILNDNSAGNDAIIADRSITSIRQLEGKQVAAELGLVGHFLLLQGLETVGLTDDDLDFRSMPTDAAAAAFANGEFDAVSVFAPFTLQALERPGSHVLFDSADFPGTIPDLLVASADLVRERPEDVQRIVEAWYATLDWIEANPDEALAIMAEAAGLSTEEYASLQAGTRIFSAEEAMEAFESDELPQGLRPMAEKINAFLVDTGLAEQPAPLDDLFAPHFTKQALTARRG
jgi:NitT/TauT family transport system substrate-binding protein